MKSIFCLILLCVLASNAKAQNLSFDELIMLRSKDVESVNSYLMSKGWDFVDATEEGDASFATTTWAFGRNREVEGTRALSFLVLWTMQAGYQKLRYQPVKKSYELFKAQLVARKLKLESSKIEKGQITSSFLGANYKVTLTTATDEQTKSPVYLIEIEKRSEMMIPFLVVLQKGARQNQIINARQDSIVKSAATLSDLQMASVVGKIGTYEPTEKVEKFVLLGKCTLQCDLYAEPNEKSKKLAAVDRNDPVCLYSTSDANQKEFYLVWSNGYYGYIKKTNIFF